MLTFKIILKKSKTYFQESNKPLLRNLGNNSALESESTMQVKHEGYNEPVLRREPFGE